MIWGLMLRADVSQAAAPDLLADADEHQKVKDHAARMAYMASLLRCAAAQIERGVSGGPIKLAGGTELDARFDIGTVK